MKDLPKRPNQLGPVELSSSILLELPNGPSETRMTISPSASSKIWWRFETFLLRLEYRRYKHWRSHNFAGIFGGTVLSLCPRHVQLRLWVAGVALNGHPTLRIALSSCVCVLGVILYVICFFPSIPFILWVWSRYGDVLAPDPSAWRRHRAIMMLGTLPDQYGDNELTRERERLRQLGILYNSSAV